MIRKSKLTISHRRNWRPPLQYTDAKRPLRIWSSVDGFRSAVAQMKANLSNFWAGYFFLRSQFGIMPKNEANHGRTGDFETIYFQFWGGLVGLVIDSMGCALTI